MKGKQVTLFGATGLIGSFLLNTIVADDYFSKVIVAVRKPISITHSKIDIRVIDFSDSKALAHCIKESAIVFSTIGTTQARVKGDKQLYRSIDYDLTFNIASTCKQLEVEKLLFVSSSGADASSSNFYINLKGEIDDAVAKMNLNSLVIFRPSLLIGKRNEFRFGERIAQLVMPLVSFLMPMKFKPVRAERVAELMISNSKVSQVGNRIIENRDIIK